MNLLAPALSRSVVALITCCSLLAVTLAPTQAQASPETLRRGFANVTGAAFDIVLAPAVAGITLTQNLFDIDDPILVKVLFAAPGYIWLTGLNMGTGVLRGVTGAFEIIPGIFLFPIEADLDPLMAPSERAPALIEIDNPLADIENPWVYYNPIVAPIAGHIRWGLDYSSAD